MYGHSSLVAGFVSVDNYGEFQHMFMPVITNKVEADGTTAESKVVLFNSSDEIGTFSPMFAEASILGYDMAIVKKEEWSGHFPSSKTLTKESLKGTTFEDCGIDMIAVCYPSHCPLAFGKKVPYGDIENMENHTIINTMPSTRLAGSPLPEPPTSTWML